ncbi:MAG: ABC transporter ATP-binding protein [Gemmatimonadales bacterium]
MISLLGSLFASARRRALIALALTAAVGLTEGLTLLLLLPLLQIAGVRVEGSVSTVAGWLTSTFNFVGIRPTLVSVLLVYVAVAFLQATLIRARTMADTLAVQDYALALRKRLYSAIASAEWLVLSRLRSSDFTFALTTAVNQVENGAHNLLFLIATAVVALVYTVLAFRVSPQMSAIVLGAVAILLVIERARALLGRRSGGIVTSMTQKLYATAAEQLGGLKTAKSHGHEARHLSLFLDVSRQVNQAQVGLTRTFASLRWQMTVGSVLALAAILYLAVSTLHLQTAAILLLLFLFSRLVPRLVALQQTWQEILSAVPALETIEKLIEECERSPERGDAHQVPISLRSGVALRDVSFSYRGEGHPVQLSSVDLQIHAGKTTAIVGGSGAGKSTVADLLLGLIRPGEGSVLVDGVSLEPSHLQSWRSMIGYVPQDTFLFNDSVRFNLAWAKPEAAESDMVEALRQAAALDYVTRLPEGLDTAIGERGVRLSGGEKQRLSLARALLRRPRLLILDEATSALDSENEERIYRAIQELHGEMTIVVITHRLSTIRDADVIHVLDEGRLVASGKWDELIAADNPRFRELCRAQSISGAVAME